MKCFLVLATILCLVISCTCLVSGQTVEVSSENVRYGHHRPVHRQHLSVKEYTQHLIEAYNRKDFRAYLGYFTYKSVILSSSGLPTAGVHKGIDIINYYLQLNYLADYRVVCKLIYADEARDSSTMDCSYSGTVRDTGNKFDGIRVIHYIQWLGGRVQYMNTVPVDYNKTISVFETQAEKSYRLLKGALEDCIDCAETKKLVADDCQVNVINLYPTSFAHRLINEMKTELRLNTTVDKMGEESKITLRGTDGFILLASMVNKYMTDRILINKVIHSDKTMVEAVSVLAPRNHMILSDYRTIQDLLREGTAVICRSKFNPEGKLLSVDILFNRPFLPWDIHGFQQEHYKENALNNLLTKILEMKTR